MFEPRSLFEVAASRARDHRHFDCRPSRLDLARCLGCGIGAADDDDANGLSRARLELGSQRADEAGPAAGIEAIGMIGNAANRNLINARAKRMVCVKWKK